MRSRLLLLAALLALLPACGDGGPLSGLSGKPGDTIPGPTMSPQEEAFAREVLVRINRERAAVGVDPVVWDDGASQVAYEHCVDMRTRGFVGHRNPDGLSALDRMRAAGVDAFTCVENVARGHQTPLGVMGGFLASPNHRATMLNPG